MPGSATSNDYEEIAPSINLARLSGCATDDRLKGTVTLRKRGNVQGVVVLMGMCLIKPI